MPQPEQIETLILGSGNGGMYLAWHMARSGRRTAVVERRWIGGSCPNINCLPSKNEIWSAKVADLVHHGANFGAKPGSVPSTWPKSASANATWWKLRRPDLQQYKASGAELIMGTGNFVAPKTLEVSLNDGGTRVLTGEQVFINIGTHATIPSIPGLDAARPLTNIEALELDHVPHHLIVLGGGYVGLEMAQAYRRFGSRVTIIEHGPRLSRARIPTSRTRLSAILVDEEIEVLLAQSRSCAGALRKGGQRYSCAHLQVSRPSRAATSWSRRGAVPTPPGSGSKWPASTWTTVATLKSTNAWRPVRPTSGRSANVPAARSSPTSPFDDFRIIRDNLAGGARTTRDQVGSLLHVHGAAARPGRTERRRGETPGHRRARGNIADSRRTSDA